MFQAFEMFSVSFFFFPKLAFFCKGGGSWFISSLCHIRLSDKVIKFIISGADIVNNNF